MKRTIVLSALIGVAALSIAVAGFQAPAPARVARGRLAATGEAAATARGAGRRRRRCSTS